MYHLSRNSPEYKIYQCYATHKKFVLNHELYIMQYTVVNLDGPVALKVWDENWQVTMRQA